MSLRHSTGGPQGGLVSARRGHAGTNFAPSHGAGRKDAAGEDKIFRHLVLAWIIEPTSKPV